MKDIIMVFFFAAWCCGMTFSIITKVDSIKEVPAKKCHPDYTVIDFDRVVLSNGDTAYYDHKKNWQP
jgi:hypothetical protein